MQLVTTNTANLVHTYIRTRIHANVVGTFDLVIIHSFSICCCSSCSTIGNSINRGLNCTIVGASQFDLGGQLNTQCISIAADCTGDINSTEGPSNLVIHTHLTRSGTYNCMAVLTRIAVQDGREVWHDRRTL